jgi:hypothetical protein
VSPLNRFTDAFFPHQFSNHHDLEVCQWGTWYLATPLYLETPLEKPLLRRRSEPMYSSRGCPSISFSSSS